MAILGYGIDIVDVSRFEKVWRRFGDRMLDRVFADGERQFCLSRPWPVTHFAARFGAKEAFVKALKSRTGIMWKDVEIAREDCGAPTLILHGKARQIADDMGVRSTFVSLSHDGGVGIAGVILEG